jgi:hypothetical protein
MKKPASLKTKEEVKQKRIKTVPQDFANRRKKYEELKELRQKLKTKNKQNVEKVLLNF